jgi:8-oxo-dGTP diphosphatase
MGRVSRDRRLADVADVQLAAAIVVHDDRVLIVRRSETESFLPGVWGVPCGKVDQGETPAEAVLRELHEETGLNGEIVCFVGNQSFFSNWRGHRVRNVQCNYLVRPKIDRVKTGPANMPEVTPPKDDQESRWVLTDEIEAVGLVDKHNLKTIKQGLTGGSPRQAISSSSIASNLRR